MRIVHISDCYLPRLGGIEVQVRSVAMAQRDRGDDVTIITATPGSTEPDPGIEVIRLDAHLPFETPAHPLGVPYMRHHLHRLAPDVVHVHAGLISPFAWMGIAAARELPTVVTVHSMWAPMQQRAFRLFLQREHRFVLTAVSAVSAQAVQHASASPVFVTPNAIDVDPWRSITHAPHDGLHIVAALRFAPRKRAHHLLDILRVARARVPASVPLQATIAGDGPLMANMRRTVGEAGLDWVHLPGRVPRHDLPALYATADVFVQPTIAESFGLAALEARAAGLAVVGRTGSGLAEFVVDGLNGFLCADDDAMADALARLAQDDALLQRLTEFNRESPPVHNWTHALQMLDVAYAEAAKRC